MRLQVDSLPNTIRRCRYFSDNHGGWCLVKKKKGTRRGKKLEVLKDKTKRSLDKSGNTTKGRDFV